MPLFVGRSLKNSLAAWRNAAHDALDTGEEDIFPDPASAFITERWHDGVTKTLELQTAQAASAAR